MTLDTVDTQTGEIVTYEPAETSLASRERALEYLAELTNAIETTYDVIDAKNLKIEVDHAAWLIRKLNLDDEVKSKATESQIWTERKLVELIDQQPKQRPGEYQRSQVATVAPSYADMGLDKRDISRTRPLNKITVERLAQYIQYMRESGNELTVGGACAYSRNVLKLGPMMSSNSPEWYTTPDIIQAVIDVMGAIDCDPCSNSHDAPNVPATTHYTKDDDGLSKQWIGRIYMNPPYGDDIPHWVDKLVYEYLEGNATQAIMLAPARTDTHWFRALRDFPRCFMFGRVKFNGNANSAPFPTMLVGLGCDRQRFIDVMSQLGDVYERVR